MTQKLPENRTEKFPENMAHKLQDNFNHLVSHQKKNQIHFFIILQVFGGWFVESKRIFGFDKS